MASRKLATLTPELAKQAVKVQACCKLQGFYLLVYCTYRPFAEQARLYRQSRLIGQINRKIERLKARGFPELAQILVDVGPQNGTIGRHVTGAGPGESWHQYRRAFDAVPIVAGKAEWSSTSPYWQKYGKCATDNGLEWAGNWTTFKEFPHVQTPSAVSNPLDALTTADVAAALEYDSTFNDNET